MKPGSALLLIGLTTVVTMVGQQPPAQASGYTLAFSEDFSAFDLSPDGYGQHTWYPGVYFQPTQSFAGPILVTPSGLDLQWNRSSGEQDTSIEGCANDASYCNTFRYGYFEARVKWDVQTGAWPAFWLITKQGVEGVQHVGEIDVFEGQGNDPTHYYGTVNEWNGGADLVSTNSPNDNRFSLSSDNDYSQWHTYGVLWTPGTLTWYYDNQAIGTAPTPSIFDQQDFFIILTCQEGNHWIYSNLDGVTANSLNLDVQWVHVFQATPSIPTPVTPPSTPAPTHPVTRQPLLSSIVPAIVNNGQALSQGPLPDTQILALTLTLPLQNQAGLNSLLQQISTPGSFNYHQFLTADEFNQSYAPPLASYSAVTAWAQAHNLSVTATTLGRQSISVSGSVAAINQAFDVTLNSYVNTATQQTFFAPDREPTLTLVVPLQGVVGLTQESSLLPGSFGLGKDRLQVKTSLRARTVK